MEKHHVDEIVSHMQGALKKVAIVGFGPLPMWMGVVGSRGESGKLIEARASTKKAA